MRVPQSTDEPSSTPHLGEPIDPWSVPVLRWNRYVVTLSYSVFILTALVIGVSLNEAFGRSDRDLVWATLLGFTFWISGWMVQSITYGLVARLIGAPIHILSLGPFGVKALPRTWSPAGALAVALGTLASLVVLASFYRLVEGGFQTPRLGPGPKSFWTMPSIGLSSEDTPWQAGAWICGVQALFQMLPLSGCLGRQLLGSLIALSAKQARIEFRVLVMRRALRLIAMAGIAISILMYASGNQPGWIMILVIAVVTWISAQSSDTVDLFRKFQRQIDSGRPTGLRASARELIRTRQGRRRTKKALQQERDEAADESQFDEVLHRVKQNGIESLSKADRELLHRVSERVRKERDAGSSSG